MCCIIGYAQPFVISDFASLKKVWTAQQVVSGVLDEQFEGPQGAWDLVLSMNWTFSTPGVQVTKVCW